MAGYVGIALQHRVYTLTQRGEDGNGDYFPVSVTHSGISEDIGGEAFLEENIDTRGEFTVV